MSAIENPNLAAAMALVIPESSGLAGDAAFPSRGFATYERLSAGQYRLTMENPMNYPEAIPFAQVGANTRQLIGAQFTEPGVVRVSVFDLDTGLPNDPTFFSLAVYAFAVGAPILPGVPTLPIDDVPGPASPVLVGRAVVAADGTLSYTSKYPDGVDVFSVNKTGAGVYALTPGHAPTIPSLSLTLLSGATPGQIANDGGLVVNTYDATGTPADRAFQAYLYDSAT
jgi:hypothetical protein